MLLLNYITLDFSRPNVAVLDYAVQGDEYSRGVVAQLVGGSQAWTPPAGAGAFIEYRRPDNVPGLYDTLENGDAAVTLDGSTATLLFSAHALQVSGTLAVALRFVDVAGRKLRSFEFTVNVKRELVSDDDVITDPYYNILSEQIADVLNAAASLTGMTVSNTTLPPGSAATATISGGSGGIPYNILFGIPRGDTGATGPQGPKGDPGSGAPSSALPLMDGTASAGESDLFARGDHVHPADTSRAAAATHNLETYTSVTQLGLTAGSATIASAWASVPAGALLVAPASDFTSASVPSTGGVMEICKGSAGGWVLYHDADGAVYTGEFSDSTPTGEWSLLNSSVYTESADSGGAWRTTAEKFNNGTLICTGYIRFHGNVGVQAINPGFLGTFVDSTGPAVSCSVDGGGAGDTSPSVGTVTPSTTAFVAYVHTNTGNTGYALRYTAIGRWK